MGKFDGVDTDPGWINRKFKELERLIKEGNAAKRTAAATIGGTGGLTVSDDAGHILAIFGRQPDGTTGFKTYRPNGTTLFESLGLGFAGFPYTNIRDAGSATIFGEDPAAGGIGRPRMTMGQWAPNAAMGANPAPATTATWVTVETLFAYQQTPWARFDARVSSSAVGCVGNVRVLDPAGLQVGTNQAVPANAVTDVRIGPVALPSWGPLVQAQPGTFVLQVQVTGGAGNIGARGLGAWGAASYDTN